MRVAVPVFALGMLASGLAACGGTQVPYVAGPPATPPPAMPAPAAAAPAAAAAAAAPPRELKAEHKAAYDRATALAVRGELWPAFRELEPFAAATAASTNDELAYWIHNELTWLRWGRGDLREALDETNAGSKALDRSTLPPDAVASMRLHALWDRAYLLEELRDPGADGAFAAYETLAKLRSDHDGLAVLTAFFAAHRQKGAEAMAAAARVDIEKDSDLQDLYVLALAFDAGGDRARAQTVRERICKGNEYLMKPLLLKQMHRQGFDCPAP